MAAVGIVGNVTAGGTVGNVAAGGTVGKCNCWWYCW